MPAAAVIPAPIVYTKVVAVEKLVVGCWALRRSVRRKACTGRVRLLASGSPSVLLTECRRWPSKFTLKKLECSKQAGRLHSRCME